jgi:hypothetical protein
MGRQVFSLDADQLSLTKATRETEEKQDASAESYQRGRKSVNHVREFDGADGGSLMLTVLPFGGSPATDAV